MIVLTLKAKHDHLEKVAATRDYVKALAEFVWNALDGDASQVSVDLARNPLGGIESIIIRDDGTGISKARAAHDFESLGESWKLTRRRTPIYSRAMHGKEGKGRLKFFSLAKKATWSTVYKEGSQAFRLEIEIDAGRLNSSKVSDPVLAPDTPTGTVVELTPLKDTFDWLGSEEAQAEFAAVFAPYIMQYPETKIFYDGRAVDPARTIEREREFGTRRVPCPSGKMRNITLKVIEWKARIGSRKIYFGGETGVVLGSLSANVTAPGFDYSAYAYSPYLQEVGDANLLEFDDLADPDFRAIVEYVRDQVGDYFRERQAEKSGELIQELKNAGVYPYEGEPKDEVERRERQVFDIATHAASSYSSVFKKSDNSQKRVTLELLREALRNSPDSISRILQAVFQLPKNRQNEFSALLEKTELGNIISASNLIADRIVTLKVLREMVFEPAHRKTVKERGELDTLVRDNTWLFGEGFHFTMAESGLTKIMNRVSDELALKRAKNRKGRKADGRIGRIDSFMGRIVPQADKRHHEFLLVELKRPSLELTRRETDQLEDYVTAILAQPDFLNTSTSWNFFLVGTEYDDFIKQRVTQKDRPQGLFLEAPNHKVWVKSWAEIIRDSEGRVDFVQEKLKIQVSASEIEDRISNLKASILKFGGLSQSAAPVVPAGSPLGTPAASASYAAVECPSTTSSAISPPFSKPWRAESPERTHRQADTPMKDGL